MRPPRALERRGVVTRFGKYTETTQPGPRWHLPFPVEAVDIVEGVAYEHDRALDRVGVAALGAAVLREHLEFVGDLIWIEGEQVADRRLARHRPPPKAAGTSSSKANRLHASA